MTTLGSQHSKYVVKGNEVIFSNPYIFNKENTTLGIFDLEENFYYSSLFINNTIEKS